MSTAILPGLRMFCLSALVLGLALSGCVDRLPSETPAGTFVLQGSLLNNGTKTLTAWLNLSSPRGGDHHAFHIGAGATADPRLQLAREGTYRVRLDWKAEGERVDFGGMTVASDSFGFGFDIGIDSTRCAIGEVFHLNSTGWYRSAAIPLPGPVSAHGLSARMDFHGCQSKGNAHRICCMSSFDLPVSRSLL